MKFQNISIQDIASCDQNSLLTIKKKKNKNKQTNKKKLHNNNIPFVAHLWVTWSKEIAGNVCITLVILAQTLCTNFRVDYIYIRHGKTIKAKEHHRQSPVDQTFSYSKLILN